MIIIKKVQSPLGTLSLASDGIALVGLWLEGQKFFEATIADEEKISFEELDRRGSAKNVERRGSEKNVERCGAADSLIKGIEIDSLNIEIFDIVEEWLERYFAGEQPDPAELKLAPKGSDFRQRVWKKLLEIPYGQTVTYGQIADGLKKKSRNGVAAQAVGGAVGHNPISIIIPCHRVVGADGSLTGYAGGIDKKEYLLRLEGAL